MDITAQNHSTHQIITSIDFITSFAPAVDLDQPDSPIEIRKPNGFEAFSTTGNQITMACLIVRNHDETGSYLGEEFYPVCGGLQPPFIQQLRTVHFHGCLSQQGAHFILPQKVNKRGMINLWNSTLEQALKTPAGNFIRLEANRQRQCYDFYTVDIPNPPEAKFPDFHEAITKVLEGKVITAMDHPIALKLAGRA